VGGVLEGGPWYPLNDPGGEPAPNGGGPPG
jgi:hypothetical protein